MYCKVKIIVGYDRLITRRVAQHVTCCKMLERSDFHHLILEDVFTKRLYQLRMYWLLGHRSKFHDLEVQKFGLFVMSFKIAFVCPAAYAI